MTLTPIQEQPPQITSKSKALKILDEIGEPDGEGLWVDCGDGWTYELCAVSEAHDRFKIQIRDESGAYVGCL